MNQDILTPQNHRTPSETIPTAGASAAQPRRDGFATVVDLISRFDRPSPSSTNRCWRCGAIGGRLVHDPQIPRRKRCHPDLPCIGNPVDTVDARPTCPQWCIAVHDETGPRRHRSATFETTLHDNDRLDRFDARLEVHDLPTGGHGPIAVCVIGGSLEFRMTPQQAGQLSDTLGALAQLAEAADDGTDLLKSA